MRRKAMAYLLAVLSGALIFSSLGYLAWQYWGAKKTNAAQEQEREQIVQDFVQLGLEYSQKGDLYAALDAFNVAIAANPDHAPQAYYYRALLYNQMERYEDALADLDKALEQEPHFPQAYAARGALYLTLDRPASAVEDLKRAIELGLTDDPTVYLNLGLAYFHLDIYDAAEANFRKALELNPNMAAAHFNLGTLYLKKGDDKAALEHLNKAIELDPNFAASYFNRAMALANLGRTEEAIQDLEKFLLMPITHNAQLQAQALLERLRQGKAVDPTQ